MKGMVFTEFLEMVEAKFSADMVDDIIDDANPASGGAYTSVGTYSHEELVDMVVALSNRTQIPVPVLVRTFGEHVFGVFARSFQQFFEGVPDALTFLSGIEDIIHAQVIKLYPDAQLPKFDCLRDGNQLTMIYHSDRHLADLAEGLIMGCGQHFGDNLTIQRDEVNELSTRFIVTKV
ncbi:MAG: hypothetical protein B7X52_07660 [Thiotrichales bacterium 34-46-19]|nr:MAG: hypothetical protein B7Y29_07990 [Thiotrichales bacterium 16-46-22]OZA18397.1 MAG: hypothetical protein B7X85_03520 [Thiotrichales bacterium 17-46-47]OZA95245.1 MAG: hypothetical protein B7X52_07660 [Thiotrichales bacterium 34-46-19]OZB85305.1 MAG: hypothetical protein B7Z48_06220 [Thiotrichales bacterium 12-47-6]HQT02650.1 heme NO-binding domain-containing protein [Thiotrichales bacterium]